MHMGISDLAFFKEVKNHNFMFQKIVKKYLDVANYLSYKRAKIHIQILCIFGYTKIPNTWIYYVYFQMYKCYHNLSFCVAHNIMNFALKFCMLVGYIIDYV
jgi:hypothetical protein